jgi:hypothetical protein
LRRPNFNRECRNRERNQALSSNVSQWQLINP